MDIVFEALYFLAIALLAITITIFVLAVSLLGRAVKLSLEDQEKAENVRKADTERTRNDLRSKLEQTTYDRESLEKSLKEYKKKVDKHNRTLRWIRWKPKFLKANWGVFIPSVFFIVAIGISALARYQLNQHNVNSQYFYLGAGLFALLFGIGLVCLTLKVIEGVAITSEETAFTREAESVKKALIEVEEAKKPELKLNFKDIVFPLHLKNNTEKTFRALLNLTKADYAENITVFFCLPESFDFPGSKKDTLEPESKYTNYIFIKWEESHIIRGIEYFYKITIKSPSNADTYKMVCFTRYKGASSYEPEEFDIIVE